MYLNIIHKQSTEHSLLKKKKKKKKRGGEKALQKHSTSASLIWSSTSEKQASLWPQAVCIRAASLVSQVADLLYKADRAIYGVKWTIFFCLFVLFCQAGEEKQKRNQMWQHRHRRLKKKKKKKKKRNPHHHDNWKTTTTTNTNTHEHRAQRKNVFNIQFFLFICSIVTTQYGCISAAIVFFLFVCFFFLSLELRANITYPLSTGLKNRSDVCAIYIKETKPL